MAEESLLSVRDLTISFGGVRAVESLSFDVPDGSIVALIGPNGAGKTTVLNGVSGFVRASGSIRYRGTEIIRKPAHARASLGIGRTFQTALLFSSMSLLDNVLTGEHVMLGGNVLFDVLRFPVAGREAAGRRRATEILRTLGIERYASRNVADLPFGVQKLAGVARALAVRPRLLLLDEPAAGLNAAEVQALGGTVRALRDELGVGILLVEHNMRLVMSISDRVVVLDQGSKLVEGLPAQVAQDPAVIEAYLGRVEDASVAREVRDELADRT